MLSSTVSVQQTASEARVLALLTAVQFVNVLDFVMVLPLGPDFARGLNIPMSSLGLVGGSYTAAAAVSGLVASTFLDRFDRRHALAGCLAGLVVATAAGGLAVDLNTLLLARLAAGAFGGPATALCLAIIADVVPLERRGHAMGALMGSYSIASVVGVPAGLEIATLAGWRAPFFAVAVLGLLILPLSVALLPPLRAHLQHIGEHDALPHRSVMRPTVLISLAATGITAASTYLVAPSISAFVQFNLGAPRSHVGLIYLVGGIATFVSMRLVGRLSDRFGAARMASYAAALFSLVLYLAFVQTSLRLPVVPLFALYMVGSTSRMVPFQSLLSRIPSANERARFSSLQSTVQHIASSIGAVLSSAMLSSGPGGALVGMPAVGTLAISSVLMLPLFAYAIEARTESASA